MRISLRSLSLWSNTVGSEQKTYDVSTALAPKVVDRLNGFDPTPPNYDPLVLDPYTFDWKGDFEAALPVWRNDEMGAPGNTNCYDDSAVQYMYATANEVGSYEMTLGSCLLSCLGDEREGGCSGVTVLWQEQDYDSGGREQALVAECWGQTGDKSAWTCDNNDLSNTCWGKTDPEVAASCDIQAISNGYTTLTF